MNFNNAEQNNQSGLFLGLEWPSMVNPMFQQQGLNLDQQLSSNHEQNCLIDVAHLNDRINETILIADRITNSMQSGLLTEDMLVSDRLDGNLTLLPVNQDEIIIDPELLTLKPK